MAVESAGVAAAEVDGARPEPVGAENAHPDGGGAAGAARRRVEERGAVVPLVIVVGRVGGELVADDVQVAAARPVVPEVGHGHVAVVVHDQRRVELRGPWGRGRASGGGGGGWGRREAEEEEKEGDGDGDGEVRRRHLRRRGGSGLVVVVGQRLAVADCGERQSAGAGGSKSLKPIKL